MKTHSSNPHLKRVSILIYFTLCSLLYLSAETTGIIKGRVIDSKNQPIEFATAALVNKKTNKIVKGEVSNNKGEFIISKVIPGEYTLSVSMMGYTKSITDKIIINEKGNSVIEKNIILKESSLQLSDVVVTAKRQFIEQTVDKMIINPEASITSASENVYEILKKLPGVTVDNNDNISLKGMQGVKILIDDKPTYVSADQLASLLKGMQGKNIDRIEIIENPSARYDAEGNSGIINIKTKHNRAPGFNGSVNTGMNIGKKISENGGIDLNANLGKLNVYGNYSFYDWRGWSTMDATRRFTSAGLSGAYQLINTRDDNHGNGHNFKVGADYFIKKNHVVSVMLRGSNGFNDDSGKSTTTFVDRNRQTDSTLNTLSKNNSRWENQTYNANYKWDIDTLGRSLSVDADYAHFFFNSTSNQNGTYFGQNGNDLNHSILINTNQGGGIDIFTAKIDYVHPINKILNMEAGLKTSFVTTDSKIGMVGFMTQSDHFVYKENIQAGYINSRAQFNKTTLQLGLRLENTESNGSSISTNLENTKSYLELFPSFFVQQTLNASHSLNFKYSYRIGRPSYHRINPFKWMLDPYTYNIGNPLLKPQFTQALSLSHNYKGKWMTSIGYNYTKDLFTEVLYQNDETKSIYQTMENLGNSLDFNASETVQLEPTKWWRLSGTLTGMYKEINSSIEEGIQFKRWSYSGNMSNNFTLPYKIELELSGNYSSKLLIGNFIIEPRYGVDLGLQRKIMKEKGVIKVSLSDVFNTYTGGAYSKYNNVDLKVLNKWDSRKLNISFNYRFGKDDFKTRSNRTTASSEEQGRSSK